MAGPPASERGISPEVEVRMTYEVSAGDVIERVGRDFFRITTSGSNITSARLRYSGVDIHFEQEEGSETNHPKRLTTESLARLQNFEFDLDHTATVLTEDSVLFVEPASVFQQSVSWIELSQGKFSYIISPKDRALTYVVKAAKLADDMFANALLDWDDRFRGVQD